MLPQGPNQRWSLDFVADQLTSGRRFRILTVVDDFTKEALATVPDTSIGGQRLVAELDRIAERRGKPRSIVSDNGGEMTSRAVLQWTMASGIDWHYIAPGKPTQNAFIEAFNYAVTTAEQAARRVLERKPVRIARPGDRDDRGVAHRLQHQPAAQRDRQSDTRGLRRRKRPRDATGRDAALPARLRASPRCFTDPDRVK